MTRKEEISKAAEKLAETRLTTTAQQQCLYDFEMGAEWADSHPHWINAEDELPTKAEFYLCVIGNTIQVLFYNEGLEEWYEFYVTKEEHLGCEDWTKKVTHWMPLPQPPKKGGEE